MKIHDILRVDAVAARMGKTRTWLSVRLNGTKVNGKPASFSPEEKELYLKALNDIAVDLLNVVRSGNLD